MASVRICIDVDDLEKGIAFYTRAFELEVSQRPATGFAVLAGAPVPIDLLENRAGTRASSASPALRDYGRHWTPLHLDFPVPDLDAALERALSAGARLEVPAQQRSWGRIALLADPFGHGFCLLEMGPAGYGAASGG